ncbi:MAG: hypothetical protein OWU32_13590 [Firmicutes bacterium]|nr:hypothetical protein [Bacillota bacterium]
MSVDLRDRILARARSTVLTQKNAQKRLVVLIVALGIALAGVLGAIGLLSASASASASAHASPQTQTEPTFSTLALTSVSVTLAAATALQRQDKRVSQAFARARSIPLT